MVHVFFLGYFLAVFFPDFDKLGIIVFGVFGLLLRLKNYNQLYIFDILLFWIFYLVYSLFFIFNSHLLLYISLFLLQYGLFYYIFFHLMKNTKLYITWIYHIVFYQSVIVLIGLIDFIIYQYEYISIIHDYHNWRIDSLYTNPNSFGVVSSLCFLLLYFFDNVIKKGKKSFKIILSLGILLSGSRMAFLIFLLGIVLKKLSIKHIKYIGVFFVFILIALLFFIDFDIVNTFFNKRLEIWSSAIDIFKNSFIFGIGSGMFQKTAEIYVGDSVISNMWGLHSMPLWLLVETGLIGTMIYSIFIINIFKLKKVPLPYKKLFLLVLITQITEFFLDHVEYFQLLYYFIIALIFQQFYIRKRNSYEKNSSC